MAANFLTRGNSRLSLSGTKLAFGRSIDNSRLELSGAPAVLVAACSHLKDIGPEICVDAFLKVTAKNSEFAYPGLEKESEAMKSKMEVSPPQTTEGEYHQISHSTHNPPHLSLHA